MYRYPPVPLFEVPLVYPFGLGMCDPQNDEGIVLPADLRSIGEREVPPPEILVVLLVWEYVRTLKISEMMRVSS